MSEIKEPKKKTTTKKESAKTTATKKATVKKETTKKTTTKTAVKKETAKKAPAKKTPAKKVTKPKEEKVVTEEVKVEPIVEIKVEEPVIESQEEIPVVETQNTEEIVSEEPVVLTVEPQIQIEMPQEVEEPRVEPETTVEYQAEEQSEMPAIEEPVIPAFEPDSATQGYKATPISEIMTPNEVVMEEEPMAEPQVEIQPTVEEPVIEFTPAEDTSNEPSVIDEPIVDYQTEEQSEMPVIEEPAIEFTQAVESTPELNTFEEPVMQPEPSMNQETPSMEPALVNNQSSTIPTAPKKKKDIRIILLILLFVLLFAFVMFMPQIQDAIKGLKKDVGLSEIERQAKEIEKEQNKGNSTPSTEENKNEQYSKLTCTSTTTALESYDRIVVETFDYNTKKEVMKSSKKITYIFLTANDNYENLKTQCNENSLKYVDKKGYETACSYNDNEVVMEDKFNLSVFSTIKDGTTIIDANAKYKEKIDTVKARLESLDYTCE